MSRRADIFVKTPQGRPLALVEVKNLPGLSENNAVELRDALVLHLDDLIRYVMVVSQSAGYLWQVQADETSSKLPHYGQTQELDMTPVLREYLSEAQLKRHLRGTDLDLVLSHWLGDLARGRTDTLPGTTEQGPLVQFVADIRGAQVNLEAIA